MGVAYCTLRKLNRYLATPGPILVAGWAGVYEVLLALGWEVVDCSQFASRTSGALLQIWSRSQWDNTRDRYWSQWLGYTCRGALLVERMSSGSDPKVSKFLTSRVS
jgi:hypothetical protein